MNATPPPIPPQASNKMPRAWLALVLFVGVIMLTVIASFVGWRMQLRHKVNVRIAAIRDAGLPINWEDMSKWQWAVPDQENAALIYTNAIAQLQLSAITNLYNFTLPRLKATGFSKERRLITANVQSNSTALDITYSASTRSKSRYPINYSEGPSAKVLHLAGLKKIARLLECQAFLKAEAGDTDEAIKAVMASFDAAHSLENEPLLVSQAVSTALLRTTVSSLERVVGRVQLSDEALAYLGERLILAEATNRFLMGIIADRAMNMEIMRLATDDPQRFIKLANYYSSYSSGDNQSNVPKQDVLIVMNFLGLIDRERDFYLRTQETNVSVISSCPPNSLRSMTQLKKVEDKEGQKFYLLARIFLPPAARVMTLDASLRATLRSAITGIAIERWRISHAGNLPDSLQQLVPSLLSSVPLDPFDGKPLRYKKLTDGYVVYSIGEDLQDDDGKEKPPFSTKIPKGQTNFYDITFTVERQSIL